MSAFSALAAPASSSAPPAMSAAEIAKRGQIEKTAQDFEASFLSVMLGEMFKGVGQGEFGGGEGGKMFQTFLTDAMSKQMAKAGGVGLASSVQTEMLKLQGLTA